MLFYFTYNDWLSPPNNIMGCTLLYGILRFRVLQELAQDHTVSKLYLKITAWLHRSTWVNYASRIYTYSCSFLQNKSYININSISSLVPNERHGTNKWEIEILSYMENISIFEGILDWPGRILVKETL